MEKPPARKNPLGIRLRPDEREAIDRAAQAARRTPSDWARDVAVAAATEAPGGMPVLRDQAFEDALARLLAAHPMGTVPSLIRACVLAIDAQEAAGHRPFSVLTAAAVPPPNEEPTRKKGSGRG